MPYQHKLHAANFADIHKHACLVSAFDSCLKDLSQPVFIDAFSGAPEYPVHMLGQQAQQLCSMIGKTTFISVGVDLYARGINRFVNSYPGSSLQIMNITERSDIRYVINDLDSELHKEFQQRFINDKNVTLMKTDGYCILGQLEGDVFYFIDPPYIDADEASALQDLCRRISNECNVKHTMIWHPLYDRDELQAIIKNISSSIQQPILVSCVYLPWRERMRGSIVLLTNYTEPVPQHWQNMAQDLKSLISPQMEMDYEILTINPC